MERTGSEPEFGAEPTVAIPAARESRTSSATGALSGRTLGHFEVGDLLGAGGFGDVYRARDVRLGRAVALKVLPATLANDPTARERFRREAMAASALNHPNICTVFDLAEADGYALLVMELLDGETLERVLARGPLPVVDVLRIADAVLDALGDAHRAGLLHRDVKPANVVRTARGTVKVLDFGIAKRLTPGPDGGGAEALTRDGTVVGTLAYMSPEQLLGKPVDARSDLFSFGVLLYELLGHRQPFEGSSPIAIADAILHRSEIDLSGIPAPLAPIVARLLAKDASARYARAEDVRADLDAARAALAGPPAVAGGRARSGRLALPAAVVAIVAAIAVAAVAGAAWYRGSRVRWARETAAPEASRLLAAEDYAGAAALAGSGLAIAPRDPELSKLLDLSTHQVSITSVPPGAEVAFRPYRGEPDRWTILGRTPLTAARVPRGFYVWRVSAPDRRTAWRIAPTWSAYHFSKLTLAFRLEPDRALPPGLVSVAGGRITLTMPGLESLPPVALDDYFIDRTEVTNEEYKQFVDAGGYRRREFWNAPFVKDGRTLAWAEAMRAFVDSTGHPGPATWELGTYPAGQARHPVAGVSWFEAAAYAAFRGRSLPTVFHWNRAAQTEASMLISPGSNFGSATVDVGGGGALSGFGTYDMAGNVKEWCSNESTDGRRFILGGGFGEPSYMFIDPDSQSPWRREPNFGFRTVLLRTPAPAAALASIVPPSRDYTREKPASDDAFAVLKRFYAYDPTPLDARVEARETTDEWTRERVSFTAAYGNERVIAYLYLPRDVRPPYQAVVLFPGSGALTSDTFSLSRYADFLPRSGRALLVPVYKGTYERRDGYEPETAEKTARYRDHVVMWAKDYFRALDYLESRPDIDRTKIAYLGLSWGGQIGPLLLALDRRAHAAVFESGGLDITTAPPEADVLNFVPRVHVPVLMLNGRYDHFFPVESSQRPLFRLLGTPDAAKRHVVYETGHAPPRKELVRETNDWLDRWLGPARQAP